MREESHLDDMRAAIRGDFDRLAERRGGQELMNASPEPAEPVESAETSVEPGPPMALDPAPEPLAAREPEPETEPAPEPVAEAHHEDPPTPKPEPRRSWLARLLGR